jgi:hypothetical protein
MGRIALLGAVIAAEIPMTKAPNPKQIPMINSQVPNRGEESGHFSRESDTFLGFGHWGMGFDWDLATWSLAFEAWLSEHQRESMHLAP